MKANDLLLRHQYSEAMAECRQLLTNPNNIAALSVLASTLRAIGAYDEALPVLERLGEHERRDRLTPGQAGRGIEISCIRWMLGQREQAIEGMRRMVDGILDRSIRYGDAAGGLSQGLLLYYMAVTAGHDAEAIFALEYMRNRIARNVSPIWPVAIAQYYHNEISFEDVMAEATDNRDLSMALEVAHVDLMSRRRLCGALFHAGVKSRVAREEEECLARMRVCCNLVNPLIELEWNLARYEVEQSSIAISK